MRPALGDRQRQVRDHAHQGQQGRGPKETTWDCYQEGAENAKLAAIKLYGEVLQAPRGEHTQIDDASVRGSVALLELAPQGTNSYDFFRPDYED